ncbi:MAG: hypothetical protein KAV99_08310 [Candidatus Latescibacteria bacterium]|nr:hypothetical protein [Candidatus Latescibacterota bacterium]
MRILLLDGAKYLLLQPKEERLERIVAEHVTDLFGEHTFYFSTKKVIKSKAGVASIPDGYVVDLGRKKRWFVVGIELSGHRIYDHIVAQIGKFRNGIIRNPAATDTIRDALYKEIRNDPYMQLKIKEKIGSGEIHHTLTNILSRPPGFAVIIDEKRSELTDVIKTLGMETKVVVLRTFARPDIQPELALHAHTFEPLYEVSPIRETEIQPEAEKRIPKETRELPSLSRKELAAFETGDVAVCPGKPSGVQFLLRNSAWGYVFIKRVPEYFALYVSKGFWEIKYFAKVSDIVEPDDPSSPVRDSYAGDATCSPGKKVIIFEPRTLSCLDEPIPKGKDRKKVPRSLRFCSIDRFAKAKSLDDLW